MIEEKDRFGCVLYIDTENDDPTVIEGKFNAKATEYQIKGAQMFNSKKEPIPGAFAEHNLWVYKTKGMESNTRFYLNEAIKEILDYLDRDKNSFYILFRKYPKNKITCYAYFHNFNPYFLLEKDLTERLNHYQIDIEFDLYFLG